MKPFMIAVNGSINYIILLFALVFAASAQQPTPVSIKLSANPDPIVAGPCKGCGTGSTDLEAVTDVTINEVGGVAGTVTAIEMELRENGTNAVLASGEFNADGVKFFAGSARLTANGSLVARNIGVHYGKESARKSGLLTYTVKVTDDQGHRSATLLAVHVAGDVPTATPTPTPRIDNGGLPMVSPDGFHIAFTSNRTGSDNVFVISADGTGELQVTHTPDEKNNVQWSSDGKQIVFSRFVGATSQIYSIGLDGKNEHEIGSAPGRGPVLSPDGKRIVYMAGTWSATRLMVSAADGTDARQINEGTSIAWNSHWSPDGKPVAFTGKNESAEGIAVFVMNADGSDRRQITQIKPDEGRAQWPVWSPDSRQLAFQVSNLKAHSGHIWTADVSTGVARKLATHDQPYLDETPSWFPDGKRIALQRNRTGRMEVWVMNADGTGQRQITGAAPTATVI